MGIIDVYRHKEGAPLRGAFPVVVQFKARREKEHVMWRAKEKLRDTDLVVTEDSQTRLLDLMKIEAEKIRKAEEERRNPKSPKKVPNSPRKVPNSPRKFVPPSPKKSPTKLSTVANTAFAMSSVRPAHLDRGKRQNIRQNNSNKTQIVAKMSRKSGLTSDEDSDEDDEDDEFDDDIELEDMLEDFPPIEKPPKREKVVLPDSPQKSLFEDFMF